jgi:hypothetical protein
MGYVKELRGEHTMNETYTRKQAMDRLGLRSINSFLFLERKYPEAFVIVNPGTAAEKNPHYDKATIDNFAEKREYFKEDPSRQRIHRLSHE